MSPLHFKSFGRRFSFKQGMFFWYQHYKALFFVCFLIVLSWGGYYWYNTLYQYHWSEDQKKEFIAVHFKETVFEEQSFNRLVDHLKERARQHEESMSLTKDIFSGAGL